MRFHQPTDDLGALEQRIADAETLLAAEEHKLKEVSLLDPSHRQLSLRVRVHQSTVQVLLARRLQLLRGTSEGST